MTELAAAFDVSRGTVYRCKEAYRTGGVDALKATRTSKGGYKLNGDTLVEVQSLLDRGRSLRAAAQAVGLTHTTVSRALEQGRLRAPNRPVPEPHGSGSRPSARSAGDALCAGGIGVKRTQERVRASTGQLAEAPPRFEAAETVAGAGVLLALPALLQQGLLDVTEGLYGRLNNGFFGLRSVLLTLAFMALLRITSPEQLKAHAPGELGLLLGLDRAPEVKTVRRKLHEIGARKLSRTLADAFARRWAQAEPEALGYLYIDGHVRPYHGRRHRTPNTFVQRRRLCMPATTEVWVNDARAQPWFFVTTEANDHLLAAIERDILAPLRKEVGAQRRVTLVFDREGWSPKAFARWAAAGFDVMTYRKGRYDPWPEDTFVAVVDPAPSRGGKPVTWRLAERETDLGTGRGQPVFRMREVRRLCDNGHQTSIMTTRRDLATPQVASRMFLITYEAHVGGTPRPFRGALVSNPTFGTAFEPVWQPLSVSTGRFSRRRADRMRIVRNQADVCALAPGELLPLYAPGIQPRPPVHLRDRGGRPPTSGSQSAAQKTREGTRGAEPGTGTAGEGLYPRLACHDRRFPNPSGRTGRAAPGPERTHRRAPGRHEVVAAQGARR